VAKLDLQPIRRAEIRIGAPLPFSIYDAHQRLLLHEGEMLRSEAQLERLMSTAIYRELESTLARSLAAPVIESRGAQRTPAEKKKTDTGLTELPLSHFKLTAGQLLQVDFLAGANRPRAALTLIGLMAPHSLLLTATNSEGVVIGFHDGAPLYLKAMVGNDLISFEAAVTRVCFVPYPYIHVAYPSLVQCQRLRHHARISTRLIATATNLTRNPQSPAPCLIANMSTGGLRLDAASGVAERGDTLRMGFKLPAAGQDHVVTLEGTVRSVDGSGADAHYGLQYTSAAAADRLVLENYVMSQLIGS
jgi:hypothetical protein